MEAPPSLGPIIGAGLLGILLAAPLFGIYSLQVYQYFLKYSKDEWWLKSLVYFLWVVLAAQYGINIHTIYAYLILDFGHPDLLGKSNGEFIAYVIFDSMCAIIVQHFFAWRLFLIIRRNTLKWLCVVPIILLSWLGLISGLLLFGLGFKLVFFAKFHSLTWLSDLWLGANVACDVIISFCMCLTLHTSRTGIKRTDRLINKLMAYSIQTGCVTSFVEIFCLITQTTAGFHYGHILVIFPLAALYCNSFLTNLHARAPNSPVHPDQNSALVISSSSTGSSGIFSALSRSFVGSNGRKMSSGGMHTEEYDLSDKAGPWVVRSGHEV